MNRRLYNFIIAIVTGALLGLGVYTCIIKMTWATFACAGVLAAILGIDMIDYFWENTWDE